VHTQRIHTPVHTQRIHTPVHTQRIHTPVHTQRIHTPVHTQRIHTPVHTQACVPAVGDCHGFSVQLLLQMLVPCTHLQGQVQALAGHTRAFTVFFYNVVPVALPLLLLWLLLLLLLLQAGELCGACVGQQGL
jgi:hypothetical protein